MTTYRFVVFNNANNSFHTEISGRTLESALNKAARYLVRPKERRTMSVRPALTDGLFMVWADYDRNDFAGTIALTGITN